MGLPPERVVKATGLVVEDKRTVGGRERFVLSLRQVEDADGTRATAGGSLPVFLEKTTLSIRRGRLLEVDLQIVAVGEGSEAEHLGFCAERAGTSVERKGWRSRAEELRAKGLERVHSLLRRIGPPSSGLLSALILGIRGSGSEGLFALFRRSGAVHLLALSGMHLGFLFLIIAGLSVPLLGKRRGLILTLAGIILYLLFVGPRPSLVRAVLMSGFGIIWSLSSSEKVDPLRLLVLAAVVQMALMPKDAYSLSFGLSYLALFGILAASGIVEKRLPFWLPPSMRTLLAAGIAAQLFSAPLLLSAFGELYPGGVFSSIVLAPIVLFLMAAGILYLLWSAAAGALQGPSYIVLDRLFRDLLSAGTELLLELAERFSRIPSLRFTGDRGSDAASLWILLLTLFVLLHYGGVILALYRRRDEATGKSRLTRTDSGVSQRVGAGTFAPVWAEFPGQSERSGSDSKDP